MTTDRFVCSLHMCAQDVVDHINAWLPKVKPGGVIYYSKWVSHISTAVYCN